MEVNHHMTRNFRASIAHARMHTLVEISQPSNQRPDPSPPIEKPWDIRFVNGGFRPKGTELWKVTSNIG
jgi:hypothetical protein